MLTFSKTSVHELKQLSSLKNLQDNVLSVIKHREITKPLFSIYQFGYINAELCLRSRETSMIKIFANIVS